MNRVGFGLGLLLVACGGAATPPPESPASEKPSVEAAHTDDATKAPSDGAKSSDDAVKSDDASSESKSGASGDELKTVLQLVLEDAELDKYLHLEEPGRFPLKLSGKDVPSDIALLKAGQPVKIVEGEPAKKDAVLVVTKVDISGPIATVDYRYDVEGVVGTAHLKKASYGWELESSRIVEHYRSDDGQGDSSGEKKKKK